MSRAPRARGRWNDLPQPFPFGLTQCGGLPPEEYELSVRREEVRPEAIDADARLAFLAEPLT